VVGLEEGRTEKNIEVLGWNLGLYLNLQQREMKKRENKLSQEKILIEQDSKPQENREERVDSEKQEGKEARASRGGYRSAKTRGTY